MITTKLGDFINIFSFGFCPAFFMLTTRFNYRLLPNVKRNCNANKKIKLF